jgi:inosine-uridine nucleoside N-ribohydrolase
MAVAMVIDPSLCETNELAIEVDARGYTRVAEGKPPNAAVAMHTDPQRFFSFYLGRVAGTKTHEWTQSPQARGF